MTKKRLTQMVARIPRGIERKEGKSLEAMVAEIKGEILTKIGEGDTRLTNLQRQLDALDAGLTARLTDGGGDQKSLGAQVLDAPEFGEFKSRGFRGKVKIFLSGGAFPLQQKSLITDGTLGTGTSGVLMPYRLPGSTPLAMQKLRIRDLMTVRPLDQGNSFDWPKQSVRTNNPSPQSDGTAKQESTYLWTTASDQVRTIAHYCNVSRQALDDVPWMRATIDAELIYGLKLKEESEILAGVGTGEHLNGIVTQATAYDTGTYNQSGDTKLDKLRHAILQARLAGLATYEPDGIVLHPTDMHSIELIKDQASNVGNYVIGRPGLPAGIGASLNVKTVWGLPVVESDSIAAGTFLVGAFASAADLIDRMQVTVEISFEHSSNFTSNVATILCEERIGLAVRKPTAFISGSY
jgi:HK97 family phage major capsid protein